jgi:Na+/proline symporter
MTLRTASSKADRAIAGGRAGLLIGLLLSALAVIPAARSVVGRERVDWTLLVIAPVLYLAGCGLGGVILGLLWPLRATRIGWHAIWIGSGVVVAAVVVTALDSPPWGWQVEQWLAVLGLGVVAGEALGRALDRH